MFNEGRKVAVIIALIGILMIIVGFTIGLVDKISENVCMNISITDALKEERCSKYINKYRRSEKSES